MKRDASYAEGSAISSECPLTGVQKKCPENSQDLELIYLWLKCL